MMEPPAKPEGARPGPGPLRAGIPAEAVPEAEGPGGLLPATGGALDADPQGPLREIARAFQMNAEALQSLKQMQLDLTASVQRGDRSELVLQSTRALNDTFRNLSSVQRELLTRLDRRSARGGRGPLIPLMLLGLLAVVVVGVYVILDEVQRSAARKPALDPVEVAQRQQDSWKEGRREGATQAERELRRLQEALEAAQGRTRKLEQDLDAKLGALGELERGKRVAELERDEFAGQVRKAQNEILAKQVLEDEVSNLRSQVSNASREVDGLRVDLDQQRRRNRDYRQRLADYGMDIPDDERPYRPPEEAPGPPAVGAGDGPGDAAPSKPKFVNLLGRARDELPLPSAPVAPVAPGDPAPARAREGGALPPPLLRRRSGLSRDPGEVQRVRARLNRLLEGSREASGQTWQVTRVDGIAQDRAEGVILLRYDRDGRLLDGIEARDLRITVDKEQRRVEFAVTEGVRVAQGVRQPLPSEGLRFVVAQGDATSPWSASGLTMVHTR